ncbi:RNA polymerase-binding protein DksA [Sulfuricurvum sp.]|uniref:RNA polymerase-binding protein DksA n=1 Tax=Sulfuricurvum sp. TaxID=2025608 RepID=UPI00262835ED|nr:RNA polymerase-binding protein DksA [Sulfuricurvum sp.]MDD2266349.1 RNA polymerase-binding protein DksA [Sulfuricurvum sp.]MDD2784698.1 RNA polymerase-binding protein DksA [Sulfuricurvum sp.]MDD2949725.1 RNA polymerase-binding protein DksA [Sulfuricurvum sp.]HZF69570.1 RNA polymerase-binding protein DksA [Sulfuricurvum sp.]
MRDHELQYFEEILLTRKAQIIKNITGVESEMKQLREMELNDEGDYASASNDNLVENAIGSQQMHELTEIESALFKIKSKVYGICEMCEDDIGFQRLKVKPHAKYCIVCRPIVEKNKH